MCFETGGLQYHWSVTYADVIVEIDRWLWIKRKALAVGPHDSYRICLSQTLTQTDPSKPGGNEEVFSPNLGVPKYTQPSRSMQDGEGMWAAILSGSGGLGEESWFIVVNHRKHIAKNWAKVGFLHEQSG